MQFLLRVESSALGSWVRESSSLWAYPTILFAHTVGLGFLVGMNTAVDLRMLGFARRIPLAPMERFFPVMWLGFWMNALSGTTLFIAGATRHAANPFFYIKMTCIALGLVNIQLLRRQVFRNPTRVETARVPMKDRILASTSLALWAGAITAGRLMAYYSGSSGVGGRG